VRCPLPFLSLLFCGTLRSLFLENSEGDCSHSGIWHSQYAQCNAMCLKGLAMNGMCGPVNKISLAHWSCCYIVQPEKPCPKSRFHVYESSLCSLCDTNFFVSDQSAGECAHPGQWHSKFGDCGVSCALNLGLARRLGSQHWSCCFATDPNRLGPCSKSPSHQRKE
jgi:hypothetical protein